MIGLNLDNVKFENMNLLVQDAKASKDMYFKYCRYMACSTLKKYAVIPFDSSIPFIKNHYADAEINQRVKDDIKLFRFALFDKLTDQKRAET